MIAALIFLSAGEVAVPRRSISCVSSSKRLKNIIPEEPSVNNAEKLPVSVTYPFSYAGYRLLGVTEIWKSVGFCRYAKSADVRLENGTIVIVQQYHRIPPIVLKRLAANHMISQEK